MQKNPKYTAYVDGSYQSSLNAGGYASIICCNDSIIQELYQGFLHTSNNRMELLAVIETLKFFKDPVDITIVSDSKYVVEAITRGSAKKWFDEGDYTKKNLDLWFELLDLIDYHNVTFVWTKGHADNKMHNRADKLAVFAARCLNLSKDEHTNYSKEGRESLVSQS